MRNKNNLTDFFIAFFIITACITIMEGILGSIFQPDLRFGYEAFFSPPFFGFLSALAGPAVKLPYSIMSAHGKVPAEPSVRQVLFLQFLHLLLIELIVFGTNYICGNIYHPLMTVVLALAIAVVFLLVHAVLWLNDRKSARMFNERLKAFQEMHR